MSDFPAHIRPSKSGEKITESSEEHCRKTALYASKALKSISLENTAYLCGLLHDMGKFKDEFKNYINRSFEGENSKRGSVNHTFAGVIFMLEKYFNKDDITKNKLDKILVEIISIAIGAHHGLFDMNPNDENAFDYRCKNKSDIHYSECKENFLNNCADINEINELFEKSLEEKTAVFEKIHTINLADENKEYSFKFYFGFLSRLLLSAVIDGDRRDTEEFMYEDRYEKNKIFSDKYDDRKKLWNDCLNDMESKLNDFPSDTPIQKARRDISDICRRHADSESGIYRLNAPTGGGKTLASLRYALAHAKKYNKSRIIYVMPLLSIIEQNSSVIRDFLPYDDIILEHHSNVVSLNEYNEELNINELLAENWSSPIIITTLVQFLNTLFSGKTSCIRRLQALCNSIVIIDEVQTVPTKMLSLFNLAVNFLSKVCSVTFVLCSATQPCVEKAKRPMVGIKDILVPNDANANLWKIFERTKIIDSGSMNLEEIPLFAEKCLNGRKSLLIICNKKHEALYLFDVLSKKYKNCFHLSSSMCTKHRENTLINVRKALEDMDNQTICVSTQVIEAGVDISFDTVLRFTAGIDRAVQSSGRCNRNKESDEIEPVYLIHCANEKLNMLEEIKEEQNACLELLAEYKLDSEKYDNNLSSYKSVDYYYRQLYKNMKDDHQDFYIGNNKKTIISLLTVGKNKSDNKYYMTQSFKTAGQYFKVFDNDTIDVIVPYDNGEEIIKDLCKVKDPCKEKCKFDIEYKKNLLKKAKPFAVSLYNYQIKELEKSDALYEISEGILALKKDFYNENTGCTMYASYENSVEVKKCSILIL